MVKNIRATKWKLTQAFAVCFFVLVVLFAAFPSAFTKYDPLENQLQDQLCGVSWEHWLGADEFGRDILCRIIYGTRTSILVGLGTAIAAVCIGVPLGLVAGYYGGLIDAIIMRVMDAFQSFPSMLLAILMMTVFEPSVATLIITISLESFPRFTRIVRGGVLSIKKQEYIESARASGANAFYIMFRSILPNCMGNIIAQFSLSLSTAILVEASLSFMGFGIQPPDPTWGSMLAYAKRFVGSSPTYILGPTLMIFFTVLSINSIGEIVKERLDPTKIKR